MTKKDLPKIFLGGFVGTAVMTLVWYSSARLAGIPAFDFAVVLGSLLTNFESTEGATGWWIGMVEHFFNGTVLFPLIYAFLLFRFLPGESIGKGLIFGIALWVGAQLVIMPAIGMGLFSSHAMYQAESLFITFNGHLVYGVLLGGIARPAQQTKQKTETDKPTSTPLREIRQAS